MKERPYFNKVARIFLLPVTLFAVSSFTTLAFADKSRHEAIPSPIVVATVKVGFSPWEVAVNQKANIIYVTNLGDGTVSVVDGATNHVTRTIQVGKGLYSLDEIAVNDRTDTVYAPDLSTGTVKVINSKTNKVMKAILVGTPPSPAGCTIFTAGCTIGTQPSAVGINKTTNTIYIGNYGDSTVSVIDGKTNKVVGSPIPVCDEPEAVAVDEKTNTIYIPCQNSGAVTVINGKTNQVIGTQIAVGSGAPTPGGCEAFSTCTNNGSDPFAAAFNQSTNTLYVAASGDGEMVVIDGKTKKSPRPFPLAPGRRRR